MAASVAGIADAAKGLARNPLGIIALFIVLIYGFASFVTSRSLATENERVLVWFMALFPPMVLVVFAWLVGNRPQNLYAPSDFKDEDNYLRAMRWLAVDVQSFPETTPQDGIGPAADAHAEQASQPFPSSAAEPTLEVAGDEAISLASERKAIYQRNRSLVLVHVLKPSSQPGQKYDVYLYVKRHPEGQLDDVARARFFFGRHWGNQVFEGQREGSAFGVATAAYGPFLATCRVTFTDGQAVTLQRYVDFEMGDLIRSLVHGGPPSSRSKGRR